MRKSLYKIMIGVVMLSGVFYSCEGTKLELLDNPNSITPDQADENYVLNGIQVSFGQMIAEQDLTMAATMRYDYMFGTYNGVFNTINAQGTNANWQDIYIDNFQNVRIIESISQTKDIPLHLGIAHVLEAYTLMTAVDLWGDVPYSEANMADDLGSGGFNPNPDDDEDLYDNVILLLDQAITELNTVNSTTPNVNDIYYDGTTTPWIKLANTIKLQAYLNLRLTRDVATDVNTILADPNNYISSAADDFVLQFSTQNANPDSRHPRFSNSYINGPGGYLANWFLNKMLNDSNGGSVDPRIRYYFYRQSGQHPNAAEAPCLGNPNYDFCYVGAFFRGRDHGDNLGIPNDATSRTVWGLYPIGGRFDDNSFEEVEPILGAQGAGITPILTHSFVQFMLAELSLTESIMGGDAMYLENAMRASFNKVRNFRPDLVPNGFEMSNVAIDGYVTNVMNSYNAGTPEEKLQLIADEFFIAAFGNATHSYNLYRRTGFPNLQNPVFDSGPFPRLLTYPSNTVNGNSNINQRVVIEQVFWDNNPAGFIE